MNASTENIFNECQYCGDPLSDSKKRKYWVKYCSHSCRQMYWAKKTKSKHKTQKEKLADLTAEVEFLRAQLKHNGSSSAIEP